MKVRARLCVELGALKSRWEAWCAQRDATPGEGIRQLVRNAIGSDVGEGEESPPSRMRWTSIGEPRERVEIRLTRVELEHVMQRANVEGFTANRWIVALIRVQFMREPQLGEHEMQLLAESNQRLAMIHSLLGRLARGANANERGHASGSDHMRTAIDAHLHTVAQLLRSNLDRWSR